MRRLLLFFCLALLAGAALAQGTAVAIGGALRDDNDAVWSRLVALAGGAGARFAVLATASGEPEASAAAIVANLQRHGALAEAIAVAPMLPGIDLAAAVRDPLWVQKVRASAAVFFSGGAQARLVDTLAPGGRSTPLLDAVRAVFDGGGLVAGTSSGAAVLSSTMFLDAPDLDAAMNGLLRDGVEVGQGFGFLPADVVIDQHFLKRGRIGRLLPLLARRGLPTSLLGIGVEEDSAAIVRGNSVEIIGARGAVLVDLRSASSDSRIAGFNVTNARLSYLARGDRYDLGARRMHSAKPRAAPRPAAQGAAGAPRVWPEMLADNVLYDAMAAASTGSAAPSVGLSGNAGHALQGGQPSQVFEWRFTRDAQTRAWPSSAAGESGVDTSIDKLRLDLRPRPAAQHRAAQ